MILCINAHPSTCHMVKGGRLLCCMYDNVEGSVYMIVRLIVYILYCTDYLKCTTVYTIIIGDVTTT